MIRTTQLSSRFAAFAAAIVFAGLSLAASVGPAFTWLPIA